MKLKPFNILTSLSTGARREPALQTPITTLGGQFAMSMSPAMGNRLRFPAGLAIALLQEAIQIESLQPGCLLSDDLGSFGSILRF
jgi:hypothetical protein